MGMSVREMECMTYHDLMCKIKGFRTYSATLEHWHRIMAYSAYAPHLGRKAKTLTLEKFWPIPELDAKRKKDQKMTPERRARVGSVISDIMKAGNGKT